MLIPLYFYIGAFFLGYRRWMLLWWKNFFCGWCKCCHGCCDERCNCIGSSDDNNGDEVGTIFLCILLIILFIFVGLFYAVKVCEKTVSRIISIIALFLMNVTLIVLSLCSGFGKFCFLVAAFSSFAALCNLIMFIIIICLECCSNNRYYNSSGKQTKLYNWFQIIWSIYDTSSP